MNNKTDRASAKERNLVFCKQSSKLVPVMNMKMESMKSSSTLYVVMDCLPFFFSMGVDSVERERHSSASAAMTCFRRFR